jgi:hypothetical protein|tara:strand:- start:372 stop:632 length:261 start_codon:yes stop_codon:yes gene_type:complete
VFIPELTCDKLIENINEKNLALNNGDRVAIVGGGPAESFFCTLLLQKARKLGLALNVTIFDRKDFCYAGPRGRNMYAGAVGNRFLV